MVGAEADTTTAVKTKAKEDSRVDNQATAAVAAIVVAVVSNRKTRTEKSNLDNSRSIVGRMLVNAATPDSNAIDKVRAIIRMQQR